MQLKYSVLIRVSALISGTLQWIKTLNLNIYNQPIPDICSAHMKTHSGLKIRPCMLLACTTRYLFRYKARYGCSNNDFAHFCTAGVPSSAVLFGPKTNHYTLEVAVRAKKVVKFGGSFSVLGRKIYILC